MSSNSREAILAAALRTAQLHGYTGFNFHEVAKGVGIKSASIYYHFLSKADLGAAVAKRYRENAKADLEKKLADSSDPIRCLRDIPICFADRSRVIIAFASAVSWVPNMMTCRDQ